MGGIPLMRTRSRKNGELPGFETYSPKKISEKAIKDLPSLISKFMHISNEKKI